MNDARMAFPADLFEPYEFEGSGGIRSVCKVLIARTMETATVICSDLPGRSDHRMAENFERVATQLYVARLHDLSAWRVRWYVCLPVRGDQPEAVCAVTLEWVTHASPDGASCFRCLHRRALRAGEVLVLLKDLDGDIRRFGVSRAGDVNPRHALPRAELGDARDNPRNGVSPLAGYMPRNWIHAAMGALILAQEAVARGDLLQCYSRIRVALEYLRDAKSPFDGPAKGDG